MDSGPRGTTQASAAICSEAFTGVDEPHLVVAVHISRTIGQAELNGNRAGQTAILDSSGPAVGCKSRRTGVSLISGQLQQHAIANTLGRLRPIFAHVLKLEALYISIR